MARGRRRRSGRRGCGRCSSADAVAPIPSSLVHRRARVLLRDARGASALGLAGKTLMAALCLAVGASRRRAARPYAARGGTAPRAQACRPLGRAGRARDAAGAAPRRDDAAHGRRGGDSPWRRAHGSGDRRLGSGGRRLRRAGAFATRFAGVAAIWIALLLLCALMCASSTGTTRGGERSRDSEYSRIRGRRIARRPGEGRRSQQRKEKFRIQRGSAAERVRKVALDHVHGRDDGRGRSHARIRWRVVLLDQRPPPSASRRFGLGGRVSTITSRAMSVRYTVPLSSQA